ncbi:MAG: extracellular solute-binding protein, partial [Oscillospiraceae bacterium]|nr:extracellular solute-binding protein [Oscillospiraceae bacterium]
MKKFLALILALVMSLALVACGGGSDDAATDDGAAESGKTTVTMIAAQYGNETADWWKGFEADFEAANADIDLVVDVVSWNDIYTVVNTRIANGEQPDLLNIDVFADYQADDLLLPAEEWVSAETYAKFFPSFLAESVVDDVVWAVPDLASARALYYNQDILTAAGCEVPTTWAELKDVCAKIKAYDAEIYPWGVDMTTDEGQACFAYYAWNNGGGFTDADGNWTLNSAENVEAV